MTEPKHPDAHPAEAPEPARTPLGRIPLVRTPRRGVPPVAGEAPARAPEDVPAQTPPAGGPEPEVARPDEARRRDRRKRILG